MLQTLQKLQPLSGDKAVGDPQPETVMRRTFACTVDEFIAKMDLQLGKVREANAYKGYLL